jgi:hypothetical protein
MTLIAPPERERVALPKQEEGLLQKVKTGKITAESTHVDSVIELYDVNFKRIQQASVFLYPSSVRLDGDTIQEIDSRFSNPLLIVTREIRDVSPQEIYKVLLQRIAPTISFMDNQYNVSRAQVFEHSFDYSEIEQLHEAIESMGCFPECNDSEREPYENDPYWWQK